MRRKAYVMQLSPSMAFHWSKKRIICSMVKRPRVPDRDKGVISVFRCFTRDLYNSLYFNAIRLSPALGMQIEYALMNPVAMQTPDIEPTEEKTR
ncbi:MAG: hypothetical protein EPO31_07100 [Gammaproteobacteria bacterium]|jgi:hypothetical protein|nr:MAG: hypothetical protein EPO31_07100 [Gammaproteobacteria bacterium]